MPLEEYSQISSNQKVEDVKHPNDVQFKALDKEYEERAQIENPYRRLLLQGETLDEMKVLKDKMRHLVEANSPKPYRHRARALYEGLENFIKFNARGEVLDEDNNAVPNSHIQDLIQYAVRDRRRDVKPVGWSQFVSLLKKHNIPKHMLNRFTLDEVEGVDFGAATTMKAAAAAAAKRPKPFTSFAAMSTPTDPFKTLFPTASAAAATTKKPFSFPTPAAVRAQDKQTTAVKRQSQKRDNPFDIVKDLENFGSVGAPTPKKRRTSKRKRKQVERYGMKQLDFVQI